MVCAHCGSESHRTGNSACKNYCTLCAQSGHRQKIGSCPYRVCNTCGETGHSARECNPRCKACGSSDHRNSSSFACPEHKCSKCKGALDPKGHNKNNCPQILSTICTLCEEVGHDEERCPTRPCPACGNRTHKSPMHFECPEHKCAACDTKGHNSTNCPTTQCKPRCKACGSSDHRNSSSSACPEHKCAKCKGALDPKGHNKNNCPQQSVHSAKKLVMMKSDAQRDRVLHVVIGRTSLRRTLNVLNTYAQYAAKKVTITRIAPPVNKCDRPFCARMSIQNCQHMQIVRRRSASATQLP